MKAILIAIWMGCFLPLYTYAQTEGLPQTAREKPSTLDSPKEGHTALAPQEKLPTEVFEKDSLTLPLQAPIPLTGVSSPFGMYGITPFDYGFATWELHKGFNASIGLNLTFSPSRFAPSGVGFGQDAAFMYAVPVNSRFSVAGGLYASNMDWGFLSYKNVGIAGVAAFKVNERISIYAYGNKSLMPQRSPYYYPLPNFCPDRLGGMVNFKLGESSSISIGVEGRKYNFR